MPVPKLTDDLNIIQKQSQNPNEDGLTWKELQAEFDKAANIIKDYLNNHIVPAANAFSGSTVATVNGQKPDESGNVDLKAAAVGAVPSSGGSMSGPLRMGRNRVTTSAIPETGDDVVTKQYLETRETPHYSLYSSKSRYEGVTVTGSPERGCDVLVSADWVSDAPANPVGTISVSLNDTEIASVTGTDQKSISLCVPFSAGPGSQIRVRIGSNRPHTVTKWHINIRSGLPIAWKAVDD